MAASLVRLLLPLLAPGVGRAATQAPAADRYFAIEVIDEQTGRGVPMVELQTTYGARDYISLGGAGRLRRAEADGATRVLHRLGPRLSDPRLTWPPAATSEWSPFLPR